MTPRSPRYLRSSLQKHLRTRPTSLSRSPVTRETGHPGKSPLSSLFRSLFLSSLPSPPSSPPPLASSLSSPRPSLSSLPLQLSPLPLLPSPPLLLLSSLTSPLAAKFPLSAATMSSSGWRRPRGAARHGENQLRNAFSALDIQRTADSGSDSSDYRKWPTSLCFRRLPLYLSPLLLLF